MIPKVRVLRTVVPEDDVCNVEKRRTYVVFTGSFNFSFKLLQLACHSWFLNLFKKMSESILAPRQARHRLIHRAGKRLNGTTTFHKREHDAMTTEKSISKTMKAVRSLSNHKEYKLQNLGPRVGHPASYLEAPSSNLHPHSGCKFSCCS